MKKLNKILLFAGLVFAAVGCEKDQLNATFTGEGEDALSAYFTQKTVSEEFEASAAGDQTVLVDIYRQSAGDELKVGIDYEIADGGEEFYEVPESVTFPAGEYHTTVPVKVRGVENFAKGSNYSVTLYVGDHHEFETVAAAQLEAKAERGLPTKSQGADTRAASIGTKYSSVTLTTTLTLEWEPWYILSDPTKLLDANLTEADYVKDKDGKPMKQTAVYTYANYWIGEDDEIVVEHAKSTSVFRMTNWGGGVNIIFTVNPDKKVTVDGKEYASLAITEQYIGDDYDSYGKVYVADMLSYSGDPDVFEEFPCYWDGERTFVFHMMYYVDGGYFGNSQETLVLDSGVAKIEDPEPAVNIVYDGLEVSPVGVKSHKLSFTPNADAAKYYATVIKADPELVNKCDGPLTVVADNATRELLAANGISEEHPLWSAYYSIYFRQNYGRYFDDVFEQIVTPQYVDELWTEVGQPILDNSYNGDFDVFEFTEACSEAWDLGTDAGTFTAVAVSLDKTGEFKGLDFHTFVYNPDTDGDAVACKVTLDDTPNLREGCFAYNSIYLFLQSPSLGDITAVQYALLAKADFEAAALTDDEKLLDYVGEHGKSLGEKDLEALNDPNPVAGGFETWLAAKPETDYKLVLAVSNPDATKVQVLDHKTAAVVEPQKLAVETRLTEVEEDGVYEHTHFVAEFTATEVVEGYYLAGTPEKLVEMVSVDEVGKVSLAKGVTEEKLADFLAENGSAFTTEDSSSDDADLYLFNDGDAVEKTIKTNKPATEFVVLACVEHGNGKTSWVGKVQRTAYAPAVAFTQTVQANGRNIAFNWSAAPAASIFKVTAVEYALVPQSALAAAGVDLKKLSDEELNDFDARIDAGGDKATIEAQKANAEKVLGVLAESVKVFQGDAAKAINAKGGVNKQFSNVEAGDYALIAVAYDAYNSKLTVGLVSAK